MDEKKTIQEIVEKQGLAISRIPDFAKQFFKSRAKGEFCNDYGMCLAAMVKESMEYARLKQMFFENNLNVQLLLNGQGNPMEEQTDRIQFGNGKKLNKGGEK